MQPPVLLGVGVRLVPGVDDRSLERGLEADLDLEEIGPLADLETVLVPVLADPTRPAPQTTWRVTKNGVSWLTIEANGVWRRIR